jgi:hypothetical protein
MSGAAEQGSGAPQGEKREADWWVPPRKIISFKNLKFIQI